MAEPSYNYSYTPTVDHRESNLFREEYYSSTDTKIYMDDEEQTEIGFIQYEIQEQLKPVYGYNSRTFDDVVIGNRIVTGTFTVPIKNKEPQIFGPNINQFTDPSNAPEIEQYNLQEANNLYNTEWFGSTNKNSSINNTTSSDIDYDYLYKLSELGYNVDSNSNAKEFKRAVKMFQGDYIGSSSGVLNEITKRKIDREYEKIQRRTLTI